LEVEEDSDKKMKRQITEKVKKRRDQL
jgi:hypothetical protein